jgi:hypothetical protein
VAGIIGSPNPRRLVSANHWRIMYCGVRQRLQEDELLNPDSISNKSKQNYGRAVEHTDAFAVGTSSLLDLSDTGLDLRCGLLDTDHWLFYE